jgi:hypothetical protein
VFGSATMTLVQSAPKTSIGGSLKLLSLCGVLLLLLLLLLALCRCSITNDFLVDKLDAKGLGIIDGFFKERLNQS